MTALALLLADGNRRGGGDFHPDIHEPYAFLIGSWAKDRIVITGDYADKPEGTDNTLYDIAEADYEDISYKMVAMMAIGDNFIRKSLFDSFWNIGNREDAPQEVKALLKK